MRYIVDGQDLLHCSGQRIPGSCVGGHKKRERLTVKLLSSNIIESQKAHSSYFAKKRSDEAKTVFSCFSITLLSILSWGMQRLKLDLLSKFSSTCIFILITKTSQFTTCHLHLDLQLFFSSWEPYLNNVRK